MNWTGIAAIGALITTTGVGITTYVVLNNNKDHSIKSDKLSKDKIIKIINDIKIPVIPRSQNGNQEIIDIYNKIVFLKNSFKSDSENEIYNNIEKLKEFEEIRKTKIESEIKLLNSKINKL